jgi:hypothetical protein
MGGFFFQIGMEHPAPAPAFHPILTGTYLQPDPGRRINTT